MPKNVAMPDGSVVEFPDNMADDQIASVLKKQQPQKGFASSYADSSGLSALAHPIDTVLGLPAGIRQMARDTVSNVKQGVADFHKEGLSQNTRRDFGRAVPIIGPALSEAQGQYDAGNYAGAVGTLAGTVTGLAAPEALKGIKPAAVLQKAAPALETATRATGEAAQNVAGGVINRTAGALKNDFKRGANGGRGYLREGGGIATSMSDLAEKSAAIRDSVGQRIGDAYAKDTASGKLYPVADVESRLMKPLNDQIARASRSGGRKSVRTQLEELRDSIQPTLDAGKKKGGLSATEIFDMKRDLAENTPSWSEGTADKLASVMQKQVGSLSGYLQEAIPELAQANQSYMDLIKLAGRAEERANTGSKPLTGHLRDIGAMAGGGALFGGHEGGLAAAGGILAGKAIRSTAARTAGATGLYSVGEGLTSVADRLQQLRGGPAAAVVGNPVSQQVATSSVKSNAALKAAVVATQQTVNGARRRP